MQNDPPGLPPAPTSVNPANVRELTRYITQEIWRALGLDPQAGLRHLLRPLVWAPTHRFSDLAARFDQLVADAGFHEAARWVLPKFITRLEVEGEERVPRQGPLLVTSNHPGGADSIALAASLPRQDLKIVVSAMPFIRGLPNSASHFIYTTLDVHERMRVVRESIRHLRQGGSLLIFPRGQVEPDPAHLPGALEAVSQWSPSVGLIVKSVPETQVVPAIVSGVLAPSSLRNPLTRIRSNARDQQMLAEILQIIQQMLLPRRIAVAARVRFGLPFHAGTGRALSPRALSDEIIESARQLLRDQMQRLGLGPAK
jgi:hypothetical protein